MLRQLDCITWWYEKALHRNWCFHGGFGTARELLTVLHFPYTYLGSYYKVVSLQSQFQVWKLEYIFDFHYKPGLSTIKEQQQNAFSSFTVPDTFFFFFFLTVLLSHSCKQREDNWYKHDLARLTLGFEGYSSLLRMSTTSNFGLLDFVFFIGVLEWLGPVNSQRSIRSSAEIRGDTSAFRSSNLIESLDFKKKKKRKK